MKALLGNIALGLAWVTLTGDFTLANFLLGVLLGAAVLWLLGDLIGARDYTRRLVATVRLAAVLFWEVLASNARVAADVLTPGMRATPAIVEVELDARGDLEILLLTMLVTLTPGTVVVHVTHDRRAMYVYGMYVDDDASFRRRIKHTFERRVLGVTR